MLLNASISHFFYSAFLESVFFNNSLVTERGKLAVLSFILLENIEVDMI